MPNKKIVIIAGEASGDFLGANLMSALKALAGKRGINVTFEGVGGPRMSEEGLISLFPMSDLSVMGISEVLHALPRILKRLSLMKRYIAQTAPDMLITVDSPDFCLRVAEAAKKKNKNLKCVHYVSPTVWAWREGRAKCMSKYLDMVLCLFPYEAKYFHKHGLKAEFVGHPLSEKVPAFTPAEKVDFLTRLKMNVNDPVLCVLPGSRRGEIKALVPEFVTTVRKLRERLPDLQVIIPTLPRFTHDLENAFNEVGGKVIVPLDDNDKFLAFASSTAALHASGTVGLELALCETPMVTGYKVSALSAIIGRLMIKTPFVNLVNILLGRGVVKERLQETCASSVLADDLYPLLTDAVERKKQQDELVKIRPMLMPDDSISSAAAAARAVFTMLG